MAQYRLRIEPRGVSFKSSANKGPLRLVDFAFMGYNVSGSPQLPSMNLTRALRQAVYYETFYARKDSHGYSGGTPARHTEMRAQRLADGLLPARFIYYDLIGSVVTSTNKKPEDAGAFPAPLYLFPSEGAWPVATQRNDKVFWSVGTTTGGNPAMNMAKQAWRNVIVDNYVSEFPPYDGAGPDVMGFAIVGKTNHASPVDTDPFNYDSGAREWYTKARWLELSTMALSQLLSELGHVNGFKVPLIANGIDDGNSYFNPTNPTRVLLSVQTGGFVEAFTRDMHDSLNDFSRGEAGWRKDVDMLADAGDWGKELLCCTKLWPNQPTSNGAVADIATTRTASKRWFRFSLGLFLLGTNGLHSWQYRHDNPDKQSSPGVNAPWNNNVTWADSHIGDGTGKDMFLRHHQFMEYYFGTGQGGTWIDNVQLGDLVDTPTPGQGWCASLQIPTGQPGAGLYVREFETGWDFVNMTSANIQVPSGYLTPGTTYVDVDGTTWSNSSRPTVEAKSARILSES